MQSMVTPVDKNSLGYLLILQKINDLLPFYIDDGNRLIDGHVHCLSRVGLYDASLPHMSVLKTADVCFLSLFIKKGIPSLPFYVKNKSFRP